MDRILLVGESWVTHTTIIKGFDSFTVGGYVEGTEWLSRVISDAGYAIDHLPCHSVASSWPDSLDQYGLVLLSDVGANTLLLPPATFERSEKRPNRLDEIAEYTRGGGTLGMIGGYMSFAGFEGRAQFSGTSVEEVLPVTISPHDDRIERPEEVHPAASIPDHPALGKASNFGPLLGYNKLRARQGADVLVRCGDDPLLAVRSVGKGRSFAYASDCAPHWAPPSYLESTDYAALWTGVVSWAMDGR
jgi:uncharacterized membrane protein